MLTGERAPDSPKKTQLTTRREEKRLGKDGFFFPERLDKGIFGCCSSSHDSYFVRVVFGNTLRFLELSGFQESIRAAGMRSSFGPMHPPAGKRESSKGSERVGCVNFG